VGVLECRCDLDLAEEPLATESDRQLGFEQLDGDASVVLQILGEKDDSHASMAQLSLEPVSIANRRREPLEELHGCPLCLGECVPRRRSGQGTRFVHPNITQE
jgi:hypothetical protein